MEKHLMYINGQFTESEGNEWMNVTNPSTDEVISQVPKATRNDVVRAINAAEEAQSAQRKHLRLKEESTFMPLPMGFGQRLISLPD